MVLRNQVTMYCVAPLGVKRIERLLRNDPRWLDSFLAAMFFPVVEEMVKRGLTVEFCNNGRVHLATIKYFYHKIPGIFFIFILSYKVK